MELEMWAHRNPQMDTWKCWGLGHTIQNYKCGRLEYATSKRHLFGVLKLTQESLWKSAHLSQRCVSRKEVYISECVPGQELLQKAFTIERICLYTTTTLTRSSSCPSQEECHQAPPKTQMLPLCSSGYRSCHHWPLLRVSLYIESLCIAQWLSWY